MGPKPIPSRKILGRKIPKKTVRNNSFPPKMSWSKVPGPWCARYKNPTPWQSCRSSRTYYPTRVNCRARGHPRRGRRPPQWPGLCNCCVDRLFRRFHFHRKHPFRFVGSIRFGLPDTIVFGSWTRIRVGPSRAVRTWCFPRTGQSRPSFREPSRWVRVYSPRQMASKQPRHGSRRRQSCHCTVPPWRGSSCNHWNVRPCRCGWYRSRQLLSISGQ
mmetsp:Transcript_12600/g.26003  ORF Transcript_12600/g.26003 Transcript_12600/m.26003 type:complete len:215 (-) Transcript_12600:1638-2282(-)